MNAVLPVPIEIIHNEAGIVTLAGQVHSRAEKKAAEAHARSVKGIVNVHNNIGVVDYRTNPADH